MRRMKISLLILLVFILQASNALRGALVRTGRATSKNWEDNEGMYYYMENIGQKPHQVIC
uniref:Candidate secreted effector n=1 Tax=Meloidogyne incognita TaxID=6306 RepID=A0A914MB31_MELIC